MNRLFRISLTSLAGIAVVGSLAVFAVSSASASVRTQKASIQVCALLPDTKTSVRYVLFDAPDLSKAFKAAGLTYSVLNAQGSPTTQVSQGEQCLTNGAKVILVDALDSGTGATIEANAAKAGVKTIDYDRLVLNGSASYYVSFNNVRVGVLQGQGLVAALKAKGIYSHHPVVAELNGAPTDNNAKLFAQGYNSVLEPALQERDAHQGPEPVGHELGQPGRPDRLPGHAREDG